LLLFEIKVTNNSEELMLVQPPNFPIRTNFFLKCLPQAYFWQYQKAVMEAEMQASFFI